MSSNASLTRDKSPSSLGLGSTISLGAPSRQNSLTISTKNEGSQEKIPKLTSALSARDFSPTVLSSTRKIGSPIKSLGDLSRAKSALSVRTESASSLFPKHHSRSPSRSLLPNATLLHKNPHDYTIDDFVIIPPVTNHQPTSARFLKPYLAILLCNLRAFKKGTDNSVLSLKLASKKDILPWVGEILEWRDMLRSFDHPFLAHFIASFHDQSSIYVVNQHAAITLQYRMDEENFLSEAHARFYLSEVLCGLEYLHSKKIIYRGVIPENILIMEDGHIQLTDFSSCERLDSEGCASFSARVEGLQAPEFMRGTKQTVLMDYWSLGYLLQNMVKGQLKPIAEIILGNNSVTKRSRDGLKISEQCISLIERLLAPEKERLGSWKGSVDIKCHTWFKSVIWRDVEGKKVTPPYIPSPEGGVLANLRDRIPQSSDLDFIPGLIRTNLPLIDTTEQSTVSKGAFETYMTNVTISPSRARLSPTELMRSVSLDLNGSSSSQFDLVFNDF